MDPLISIIIPSYNRSDYIGETLDSVMAQVYENWECIVVDDGSTDRTDHLLEFYCRDKRIKYFSRPSELRKGASSCRNFGFEKSKGDYIQYLDTDDLLSPDKLKEQIEIAAKGQDTLITCKWGGFNWSENINQLFKHTYHSYRNFDNGIDLIASFGKHQEYFPPHVYLTPRNLVLKAGPWNEDLSNNDDGEFFTRIILNSDGIFFAPGASVYYRYTSSDKLSFLNSREKLKSAIYSLTLIHRSILEKFPDFNDSYREKYKDHIYYRAKEIDPVLIKENTDFFKDQIRSDKFLRRINNRLKQIKDKIGRKFHLKFSK